MRSSSGCRRRGISRRADTLGRLVGGLVALGAVAAGIVAVRQRWVVVDVRGDSMLPALRDGDVLLARRSPAGSPAGGDVVVFATPDWDHRWRDRQSRTGWLVKRVAATPGDPVPAGVRVPGEAVPAGSLVVLSDHVGYDSRDFGLLPAERVMATVVRRLPVRRP